MYARIWSRPPSERLRNFRPPDFLSASVQATSPQASIRSRRFRENQKWIGPCSWMGANDSKRKPPSEMSKTVPPSSCSSCRKANSFGTVLVFSRRSRVTFLRVMSFRRLVYFRNALQRRGGEGVPHLLGCRGCGPRRPPPTRGQYD